MTRRPDVAPSNEVYVAKTKHRVGHRSGASLHDFWSREGVGLREVLSDLHEVPESRLDVIAPIDGDARFDFALVPPRRESADAMRTLMRNGIAQHFHVDVVRESRSMDVYVLTAPNGITGIRQEAGGGFTVMTMEQTVDETVETTPITAAGIVRALSEARRAAFERRMKAAADRAAGGPMPRGRIAASGSATTEHLGRMLEGMLDRPVVDETGAVGDFAFNIDAEGGVDGFLAALREQLGISVTPARRDVEFLVVRPA